MKKNKKLYWLRNVQSQAPSKAIDDFHRHLSKEGKQQACHLCSYFNKHTEIHPNIVFCSGAVRCRETWESIASVLPKCPVVYHQFLYLASGYTVLELISFLEDSIDSVMIIGHGRALNELPKLLALSGAQAKICHKCAHGTFVQIMFDEDVHWGEINFKKAELQDIFYP